MSMTLTEVYRPASLLRELVRPTSQPMPMRHRPRPAPANEGWADVESLGQPRAEDPSRPLAGDDVRLAPRCEAASGRVKTADVASGFLEWVRSLLPHVDTAFMVVLLAAEFAVGSYCAAQAVQSFLVEPAVASQRALH